MARTPADPRTFAPLGRAILRAAGARGWDNLHQVAVETGWSYGHLRDLATGRRSPTMATVERLADALGTSVGALAIAGEVLGERPLPRVQPRRRPRR